MRILTGLVTLAALGATAAAAQPGRLTDVAYMQAARCVGLASSGNLGTTDAKSMASWLDSQASGRDPVVLDKADEMRGKAKREADHADQFAKAKLTAELSGSCATLKG